jgi:hypothetical protein
VPSDKELLVLPSLAKGFGREKPYKTEEMGEYDTTPSLGKALTGVDWIGETKPQVVVGQRDNARARRKRRSFPLLEQLLVVLPVGILM